LDTDTLSEFLKVQNSNVIKNAKDYQRKVGPLAFSSATRFEILRGYKHRLALRRIAEFETFCTSALIIPTTDDVWDLAAELWALGRARGFSHTDTDLIIAATARTHNRILVTGNTAHFAWIPNLLLADWR
jgi:tRNA(fMet)-specific endonuclease VapC